MKRLVSSGTPGIILKVVLTVLFCLSTFGIKTFDAQAFSGEGGVYFPDANLRAAINDALGRERSHSVIPADLESLTYLYAAGYGVADLEGLQYGINLDRLSLGHNPITNIEILHHLTDLKELSLGNTSVSDYSPLSYLTNLSVLGLNGANISNISFLDNLNGLTMLSINNSNLSNLGPLEDMEYLSYLNLADNKISSIESLRGLPRLKELDLIGNQVSSISALEDVPTLETLWLYFNQITSIAPLENCHNLYAIWADFNQITSLEPITGLTSLVNASFARNQIEHIPDLSELTSLQRLDLFGNNIAGFWLDTQFPEHLKILNLSSNPLGTFSFIYGIAALHLDSVEVMGLANCGLTSGFDIDELPDVKEIYLSGNQLESDDLYALVGGQSSPIDPPPINTMDVADNLIDSISTLANWTRITSGGVLNVSSNFLDITPGSDDMADINVLKNKGVSVTYDPQKVLLDLPDDNLEAAVKAALHRSLGYILTSDFNALTYLAANNANITNLSGLEKFPNLQTLVLANNQISDISPLTGLTKLMYLYLNDNQIVNIPPLSGLTKLNSVTLANNQIDNITALAGLPNLYFLYLDNNHVNQISALSGLTKLIYLGLSGNTIEDISVLASMTNLQAVYLDSNRISNISALTSLLNLQSIRLSANLVSDLSPLNNKTTLYNLELDSNPVTDIHYLSTLSNLRSLKLCSDNIDDSDLSFLVGLGNLSELYLNSNQVTDISQLAGMENLYYLAIVHNHLDISAGSATMNDVAQILDRGGTVLYYPQQTEVVSLGIDPPVVAGLPVEDEVILKAVGTYADGSQVDLSTQVAWVSSNNAVAWVGSYGVVTGAATGIAVITASLPGGLSADVDVTVIPPVHLAILIPAGPDDSPTILPDESIDLLMQYPAQDDVTFAAGEWKVVFYADYYEEDYTQVFGINIGEYGPAGEVLGKSAYQQPGLSMIQSLNSVNSYPLTFYIDREGFTVHQGNYLGITITNHDQHGNSHVIFGGHDSYLKPPSGSPSFPVPELPAGILLGIGIVGLRVYALLRRSKTANKAIIP